MRSATAAKLLPLLAWMVPVLAAALGLWHGFPSGVSAAAYDANLVFGIVALLVTFLLPSKNLGATALARLLILIAASLPVSHIWIEARCDGALLAGLFPQSDAGGYLSNAIAILGGRPVWDFATRPICFSAFAPLVLMTGFNLKALVVLLTLMNAAAIAVTAGQVQKFIGGAAAGLFTFGGLCLYRITAGWLMTEQMGIVLGMAAAALFVAGCRENSTIRLAQSLFMLSLALLCRAGAFFALPALAAGITLLFPLGKEWRGWLRPAVMTGAAMVLAVALDFALGQTVYEQGKRPPSNFWYVAWGVLNETDWTAADKKFNHQVNLIKEDVIAQAKREPGRIASGAWRAVKAGFHDDFFFSHLRASPGCNLALSICSLASLLGLAAPRTRRPTALLSLIFIGTLASLPFAPPWDGGVRIHAAILPLLTLIPALGLAVLVTWMRSAIGHRSLVAGFRSFSRSPFTSGGQSTPPDTRWSGFVTRMPVCCWLLVALSSPLPIACKLLGAAHVWPDSIRSRLEPADGGVIDPGFVIRLTESGPSYALDVTQDHLNRSLKSVPWDHIHYTPTLTQAPTPCRLKCVFVPEEWKSYALDRTVTVHRFAVCITPATTTGRVTRPLRLPKDEYWNSHLLLDSTAASPQAPAEWQSFAKLFR